MLIRSQPVPIISATRLAALAAGEPTRERSLLVGVVTPKSTRPEVDESLDELSRLVDTFGADSIERVVQVREDFSPAYLIGKGKAHEIAGRVKQKKIDMVIFDDDLSPVQQRNLETTIGKPVIDRCGLILEIFSLHARTHEAKLQVDLAKERYLLPRLTNLWTHFSRQRGGGGVLNRGAGETQLEVDRRRVRHRISQLKRKLEDVSRHRATRRKGREASYRVALVGYTNSGKSTLMNSLTDSNVIAEDRLFATLDSTVRTITTTVPRILLTDTVGFIRKLPHSLVASFKSTLEEVAYADLLLQVVDISDPGWDKKIEATNQVLAELDLDLEAKPRLLVFNKVDLLPEKSKTPAMARSMYPESVCVSGVTGEGLVELRQAIKNHFSKNWELRELELTYQRADFVRQLQNSVHVESVEYLGDKIRVHLRAPDHEFARIERRLAQEDGVARVRQRRPR